MAHCIFSNFSINCLFFHVFIPYFIIILVMFLCELLTQYNFPLGLNKVSQYLSIYIYLSLIMRNTQFWLVIYRIRQFSYFCQTATDLLNSANEIDGICNGSNKLRQEPPWRSFWEGSGASTDGWFWIPDANSKNHQTPFQGSGWFNKSTQVSGSWE